MNGKCEVDWGAAVRPFIEQGAESLGVILPRLCRWDIVIERLGDEMTVKIVVPGILDRDSGDQR